MTILGNITGPFRYLASVNFRLRYRRWMWRTLSSSTLLRYLVKSRYSIEASHLECEVFGRKFASPIGLAAGFDRNGDMIDAMAAAGFGFVEVGSITSREQHNTTRPATFELKEDRALIYRGQTDCAGVEQVIENIKRRHSNIMVGCNIVKSDLTATEDAPTEYLRLFRPLYQYADYFTVNIAYNSTAEHYTPCDRDEINAILTPLFEFRRGQNQYRPILLKISPDLSDEQIDMMTDIMIDTPLDGIVACGGTAGRHGLEKSTSTMHAIGRTEGTLCGHPLRKRAIEVVKRIYERSKGTYPIIGCGGVSTAAEAREMMAAGASLVQICNEFIYGGCRSLRNINSGLEEHFNKEALKAAKESAEAARTEAEAAIKAEKTQVTTKAEAETDTTADTSTEA